jgi:uncharacterized protein
MKLSTRIFSMTGLAAALLTPARGNCAGATGIHFQAIQAAAAKGDARAEFELALCFEHGDGVVPDDAKAFAWMRKSANQGYANAQACLGSFYAKGQGVARNLPEALQWYREAAAQNNPLAEYCLGYAYARGEGAPKEMNTADQWWLKAADQGQVYAQYALGQFYFRGERPRDTNINYAAAAKWLHKAADQGYAPAMATLGYMYQHGVGVTHDWQQTLKWNRPAADLGDALAQDNLGQMYLNGDAGLPLDKVQAYKWFLLSAKQGNPGGQHDVIELELHHVLTPEETADAERLAAKFHAQARTNELVGALEFPK